MQKDTASLNVDETEPVDSTFVIERVEVVSGNMGRFYLVLTMVTSSQLDTGATSSLISYTELLNILLSGSPVGLSFTVSAYFASRSHFRERT